MKVLATLMFGVLLASGSAWAADSIAGLWSKPQFEHNRADIIKTLADPGGKYREISPADQKKVQDTLDHMEQRWQSTGDAPLTQAQQVEMANDQEVVTTTLDQASADSRVKCERETPIGSNLPKTICKTVAQRNRELKAAQDAARQGSMESH